MNAWGIAASATSPWWVSNNGSNSSTLYTGAGAKLGLEVAVAGAPTGIVSYPTTGTMFRLSGGLSARFIWATESGTLLGWRSGSTAEVVFTSPGLIYKGLAIHGDTLYTTDFAECDVETLNGTFTPFNSAGQFQDDSIPAGYCPFGIQAVGDSIFVTYAKRTRRPGRRRRRQATASCASSTPTGNLTAKVAIARPAELALGPRDGAGRTSASSAAVLLVGNFGDGLINALL